MVPVLGTVPVSGVLIKGCTSMDWYIYEVHQKYDKVHIKPGWEWWDIFSWSYQQTAIFKPTIDLERVFQPARFQS